MRSRGQKTIIIIWEKRLYVCSFTQMSYVFFICFFIYKLADALGFARVDYFVTKLRNVIYKILHRTILYFVINAHLLLEDNIDGHHVYNPNEQYLK